MVLCVGWALVVPKRSSFVDMRHFQQTCWSKPQQVGCVRAVYKCPLRLPCAHPELLRFLLRSWFLRLCSRFYCCKHIILSH